MKIEVARSSGTDDTQKFALDFARPTKHEQLEHTSRRLQKLPVWMLFRCCLWPNELMYVQVPDVFRRAHRMLTVMHTHNELPAPLTVLCIGYDPRLSGTWLPHRSVCYYHSKLDPRDSSVSTVTNMRFCMLSVALNESMIMGKRFDKKGHLMAEEVEGM